MTALELTPTAFTMTLFGPMQVMVEGRPLPRLRSRKGYWLLALLVLRGGRAVEREWLAGTLWPGIDQSAAAANLRVTLSTLRGALGSQNERLYSPSRHTLAFNLSGADIDIFTFDEAIGSKSLETLERAVALYLGPLLEGCAEEWAEMERSDREQHCLEALQTLADAALAAKDWETASRRYRRAIALDPWREALRRGQMRALAGSGDGNAAMDVYKAFVRLLRKDDPKAAPDEETTALYAQLRAAARRRASAPILAVIKETPDAPLTAAKTISAAAMTGSLTHALTNLIGREDEREELVEMLGRSRLVTLTGPGGIGKTRLAIAVAEEVSSDFADGVCLVALEALSDGGQLALHIAGMLGLKDEAGRTPLESLSAHLRSKRLLLVLDNCEHLLDASAQLTGGLLRECAGLRILATSREALGVIGETVWMTPALSTPDPAYLPTVPSTLVRVLQGYESVQLFVERAQSVQKTFSLNRDNARAVAQICARMEGIPLAIELAAARVRSLTVQQISARLDDHLALLTGGNRASHSRQQTLRSTLDWSYALLNSLEQQLLACVSIFSGGWNLEAAEGICSNEELPAGRVLDLLTSLVDKSLVVFDAAGGMKSGRYRLLEMVRQYAGSRLAECGHKRLMHVKHRDWFLKIVEEADLSEGQGAELVQVLQRLEMDYDNLRSALVWCEREDHEAQPGLRLAGALWRYWGERGFYSEGRAFLHRALSREDSEEATKARVRVITGAAILADRQGDFVSARAYYQESLAINRKLGDTKEAGSALGHLNDVAYRQGDTEAARAYYEEAREHYEQSLIVCRERGDKKRIAEELSDLGVLAHNQGLWTSAQAYYDEARSFVEQALELYRDLDAKPRVAIALNSLGVFACRQGDFISARAHFEESVEIAREQGNKSGIALCLVNLGSIAAAQGDDVLARSHYEQSVDIARELRDKTSLSLFLDYLGIVTSRQGDFVSAREVREEQLLLCMEIEDRPGMASGLEGIATVMMAQGNTHKAVRLWGAALMLRERVGAALLPHHQARRDLELSQARAALGDDPFAAAWEEGRAMTLNQAAKYALDEV